MNFYFSLLRLSPLTKNGLKYEHACLNLQHGVFTNFNGKQFVGEVGLSNEKEILMKFFLEKHFLRKSFFQFHTIHYFYFLIFLGLIMTSCKRVMTVL